MTTLKLNDVLELVKKTENLEIEHKTGYEINKEHYKKLLAIMDETNFCTFEEYLSLNETNKNKPTFFVLGDDILNALGDIIGKKEETETPFQYFTRVNNEFNITYILKNIIESNDNYKTVTAQLGSSIDDYLVYADNRELYKNIIKILYTSLQYITFREFSERIKTLVNLFIQKALKTDYPSIIFFVSDKIKKSNTWVFCLFMKYMTENDNFNKFKKKYSDKCKFLHTEDINESNIKENSAFLHFDDMTYSGTQLGADLENNYDKLKDNNIKYYLIIPYLTTTALNKFITNEYDYQFKVYLGEKLYSNNDGFEIHLLDNEGIIRTIGETLEENEIFKSIKSEEMKEEIKFMFGLYDDQYNFVSNFQLRNILHNNINIIYNLSSVSYNTKPVIFFEHKLADNYSTFLRFIYVGPIIGFYTKKYKGTCLSYPIIKPCLVNEHLEIKTIDIETDVNCGTEYSHYNESLDNKYGCPVTYYKQDKLQYKYNDKLLNKNQYLFKEMLKLKKQMTNNNMNGSKKTKKKTGSKRLKKTKFAAKNK